MEVCCLKTPLMTTEVMEATEAEMAAAITAVVMEVETLEVVMMVVVEIFRRVQTTDEE